MTRRKRGTLKVSTRAKVAEYHINQLPGQRDWTASVKFRGSRAKVCLVEHWGTDEGPNRSDCYEMPKKTLLDWLDGAWEDGQARASASDFVDEVLR